MPWNNQSGGGGGPWGGGGNNGGPWGQGPRPSGPQGSPPDLEDIIRRGQDRLRRVLPGGGRTSPAFVGLIALAVLAFWVFQAVYTVQPDEVAVELRFGKPKDELSEPGLHFHWWPIETVEIANTAEKLVDIGGGTRDPGNSGLMLSGDQNIVDVQFSVAYQVVRSEGLSVQRSRSRRHGAAGRRKRHARGGRPQPGAGYLPRRPARHRRLGAHHHPGLARFLWHRAFGECHLDRGRRAAARSGRRVRRSAACRAGRRPLRRGSRTSIPTRSSAQARGQASQVREDAAAYKNRVAQEAEGEAKRFLSVYNEYAKAPDVTRKRLFIETMEKVLQGSNKVIVEQGTGQGVLPYLPLPELEKRKPAATGGSN